DESAIAALGIPRHLLPEVRPTGQVVGELHVDLDLPFGLPVVNALGDNQASFLGAVADPEHDVLVNVGTGGQVSATSSTPLQGPLIETRPLIGGDFLIVGAGLAGGRAYAALHDFVADVGRGIFGVEPPDDLYERLNRLAASVTPGGDGVRFDPRFEGS